jgi:hypothetical protein
LLNSCVIFSTAALKISLSKANLRNSPNNENGWK